MATAMAIPQVVFSPWFQGGNTESGEVALYICEQYAVCAVLWELIFSHQNPSILDFQSQQL